MNEALELAGKLYAYVQGDEYQRVTEEAAAILCSQHAEIERLKASNDSYITLANTAYEITDALRAENQTLRDALENIAYTTAGLDCNDAARAALVDTRIKVKET